MQLVLSLFPGIDLFGRGFESEGYCVVRGPDLLWSQDVRAFHTVPGRFDGIIGGPPCPDFSKARRGPPSGDGVAMLTEFRRVVTEAAPAWWLIEGYSHQRIDLNAAECGLAQNRLRHFQFGHRMGRIITIERTPALAVAEPCCTASEGAKQTRRDWGRFCELQGLPRDFSLPNLTRSARYRAVGNGVPLDMARIMARAVAEAKPADEVRVCLCACGREVKGKAVLATPACRKRMQRRREAEERAAA